ncbi:alpha/beta hydrolase-fold protein [Arthrobacter sp. H35-D1]|uniref:alpha/beta hydrolase n=1 Tax=Arthrobacter sp. H35-D1 TaxID=3046202 RepID=UPI0024BB3CEA|nr:alpha/beta hydrolase-fold protein [Arthrobacter sp. H35-D1]MDJ0313862.1 alpha/beta hydrolase-fold protein [Arthrobacter sp. H35-D1]
MSFIDNIDLISGPFPLALTVLALISGVMLLLRRHRGWVPSVVCAAALAALMAWAINWYVVNVAALSAYDLPLQVLVWIGVGVFAVLLMVLHLISGRLWRRVLAPLAMGLVLATVGMQVNAYYGSYRTVGDVTGASTANIAPLSPNTAKKQPGHGWATKTSGPAVDRWEKPAGLPVAGTVNSVQIPGRVSGFTGRTGYVYLPPAYQATNQPLLPVLVLIAGQPGSPADWLKAGELQKTMDTFAAAHQGLAPVVVVPDVNGSNSANTMCMDSQIAKTDTYLAVDVPAWIKDNLTVDSNPQHWAVGGFSFGGTCALQMVALHPKTYPSAIDLSGEAEPALSADMNTTIQKAFGGNTAAFDAVTPLNVMAKNKYPQSWIYFAAGAQDRRFTGYMNKVSAAARSAGMTVTTHSVPGAGHSWDVPLNALGPALTWLAPRLGLAH